MAKQFQHLAPGETISRREYNRITDVLNSYLASNSQYSFRDSGGIHVRRTPETVRHGHAHWLSTVPVVVPDSTFTVIPLDFQFSDPDGWYDTIQEGFVVPADGVYFVSIALWVVHGANRDTYAYSRTFSSGGGNYITSSQQITPPAAYTEAASRFHLNGMVTLDKDDVLKVWFYHEAGGANTMAVGAGAGGTHASIWLMERI